MTHWLEQPDKSWPMSDLPDPLERCGRHVLWAVVAGIVLSHGDWARTHEGACPPLCRPYPVVAPANPHRYLDATAAWKLMFGTYKPRKPVDEWVIGPKVVPLKFDVEPYA